MKFNTVLGVSALSLVLMAGLPPNEASAQTQCPVGTAAGSATCAPDAPQGVDTSTMGYR